MTLPIPLNRLIRFAGLLHFYEIPAILFLPKAHDWESDLAKLAPINRKTISVLRGGVVIMVLGLGAVVAASADEIAGGGRLAAQLCLFLGVAWVYRDIMQLFVFSPSWS